MKAKRPDPTTENFEGKISTHTGTFGKIKEFFKDVGQSAKERFQQKKVSDEERQERFKKQYEKEIEEQNKRLDKKAEAKTKEFILDFIHKNMNRTYYNENKVELFFEKVFAL